jgi:hypothetical protein
MFFTHCTENLIYVLLEMKLRGLIPNSCDRFIYSGIGLPIYKSLTDT